MLNSLVGIIASSGGAAGGGAYESIATLTASGGETSLAFTSIPSTYSSIQIRGIFKDTSTSDSVPNGAYLYTRVNGSSTGYASHRIYGNGSTVIASADAADNALRWYGTMMPSGGIYGSMYSAAIMDVHNYASTTQNKTFRFFAGNDANQASTNRTVNLQSGLWVDTTAITTVTLFAMSSGFAAGSTFALYGIKGA